MKKKPIYILFDDMMRDFTSYCEEMCEEEIVREIKKYLKHLSKTSKIMIITHQNVAQIKEWFLKNGLHKFVDNISNPNLVKYFTLLNNPDFFKAE
jgi:hypothetical protein